jgi:hypothetical protein
MEPITLDQSTRGDLFVAHRFSMSALLVWLNAQWLIDGVPKLLLAPEVSFCSLDGDMSE